MNNQTRYPIVLYGLKAEHFKRFDHLVLSAIEETFFAEGFPANKIKSYLAKCGEVVYTKTHDRSILGQINEFLISISWEIEDHLPSSNLNLVEVNKWAGGLLCGASVGYVKTIELLQKEMSEI